VPLDVLLEYRPRTCDAEANGEVQGVLALDQSFGTKYRDKAPETGILVHEFLSTTAAKLGGYPRSMSILWFKQTEDLVTQGLISPNGMSFAIDQIRKVLCGELPPAV